MLMQDRKNVAIALLAFIVMMLAVRGGQEPVPTKVVQPVVHHEEAVISREQEQSHGYDVGKADPCAPCSLALQAAQASCAGGPATVTVTETHTASVTVEATAEAVPTEEAQAEVEESEAQAIDFGEATERQREL